MKMGVLNPESWKINSGTQDFWKLMENGDLVDDEMGWLKDQNGNYNLDENGNRIGAEGIETGLLNILNGGTSNAAYSSSLTNKYLPPNS